MTQSTDHAPFGFTREQIETFIDTLPYYIGYVDAGGRIVLANRTVEEWFGRPRDTLRDLRIDELIEPRFFEPIASKVRAALAGEQTSFHISVEVPGDRMMEVQLTYTPDSAPDGRIRGFFFLALDVSSARRAEEELLRSQQVLEVITREQQRISHDLHDTVGQELTALSLSAKRLAQKLEARGAPEAGAAATMADEIKQAIVKLRKAVKGVVPVEVDARGLMVALEHLALSVRERHPVDCRFHCPRPVKLQDRDTATHLYRIAREAVNNALKHGRATRIVIGLESISGEIRLIVENDGLTIEDDPDSEASGIGVRIMQFRAGVIGAKLVIEPAPGGGTRVACTLRQEPAP
jgi:PAS domain S-box-containing protein